MNQELFAHCAMVAARRHFKEQIGTAMATQFWTIFKYRPKFWKVPRTQTKVNQRLFPLRFPAAWPLPVSPEEEQIWTKFCCI